MGSALGTPRYRGHIQSSSYLLGQRFNACLVLKLASQRGEKRESVQFFKKHKEPLTQEVSQPLCLINYQQLSVILTDGAD